MSQKLTCADFTFMLFVGWGCIDLAKNWQNYTQNCD